MREAAIYPHKFGPGNSISNYISELGRMREAAIYPHKFGLGIPNPVGNATFRGLENDVR